MCYLAAKNLYKCGESALCASRHVSLQRVAMQHGCQARKMAPGFTILKSLSESRLSKPDSVGLSGLVPAEKEACCDRRRFCAAAQSVLGSVVAGAAASFSLMTT